MANFVTTSQADQLIRVQMAPVLGRQRTDAGEHGRRALLDGYVLILDNITRSFEVESRRDQMLQSLTEGSRASLANIRAAVENLLDYPDMETEQRDRFVGIIRRRGGRHGASGWTARRPNSPTPSRRAGRLEDMLGVDLVQAARRRDRAEARHPDQDGGGGRGAVGEGGQLLAAAGLTYLVFRLRDEYEIREVRFRLRRRRAAGASRPDLERRRDR